MCIVCFSLFIVYNNYKIIAQRNKRLGRASSPRDAQLQNLFIFIFFISSFFSFVSVTTLWAADMRKQNDAVVPRRIHRPYRDLYLTPETSCDAYIITIPAVNTRSPSMYARREWRTDYSFPITVNQWLAPILADYGYVYARNSKSVR